MSGGTGGRGRGDAYAQKKIVLGGMTKLTPSDKHRKELNVFYTCLLWSVGTGSLRTAAILSSISCSYYDFLYKPIKNNLFNAPITEQNCLFYINTKTCQQLFMNISESTKNMFKQRFPNFFKIIFEIESMI